MDCKTTKTIKAYASLSTGDAPADLKHTVVSANKIFNSLRDSRNSIGDVDFERANKERRQLYTALNGIPEFKNFGMVLTDSSSRLLDYNRDFINTVITSDQDVDKFFHTMGFTVQAKGDYLVTTESVDKMNAALNNRLNTSINVVGKNYLVKSGNRVLVSKNFRRDINRMKYSKYRAGVAALAGNMLDTDPNTPRQISKDISGLREEAVLTHMQSRIRVHTERMKQASVNNNAIEVARQKDLRTNLQTDYENFKKNKSTEDAFIYLEKLLIGIEDALASEDNINIDNAQAYQDSLTLLINSANIDDYNPIFSKAEILTESTRERALDLRNKAEEFQSSLNDVIREKLFTEVSESLESNPDKSKMLAIGAMDSKTQRRVQMLLGPDHLDNPLVDFITQTVDEGNYKADLVANTVNEEIEDIYDEMVEAGIDQKQFIGRDKDGLLNGSFVDPLNQDWFANKWKLSNSDTRNQNLLDFNPEILFTTKFPEKKKTLVAALKNNLGNYMYEMYLEEARDKWDHYRAAEKNYIKFIKESTIPNKDEYISSWILANSPVARATKPANYQSTSDNYLVFVPRAINSKGEDSGFYDETFKELKDNKEAMSFFKKVRETHKKHAMDLHKPALKFEPPRLAYISKSVKTKIGEGKLRDALKTMYTNVTEDLTTVGSMNVDLPKNPYTNKAQPRLKNQLHSIRGEAMSRVRKVLRDDDEYKALEALDAEDNQGLADAYAEKILKEKLKEVEEDYEGNVLQSIRMNTLAMETESERKKAEARVGVALSVFDAEASTGVKDKQQEDYGKREAMDVLNHFLNTEFYDMPDSEIDQTLDPDKDLEKKGKHMTTRKLGTALGKTLAYFHMSWRLDSVVNNGLMAYLTGSVNAIDSPHYDFNSYQRAYTSYAQNEGVRKFLNRSGKFTGDISTVYNKEESTGKKGKLKRVVADPLGGNKAIEKLNQGVTAIAIMMNVSGEANGVEMTMYDAVRADGTIDPNFTTPEFKGLQGIDLVSRVMVTRIKEENNRTSGNYRDRTVMDKDAIGKLALVFTRYLPELVIDTFGSEKDFNKTGFKRKGRFWHGKDFVQMHFNKYMGKPYKEMDAYEIRRVQALGVQLGIVATINLMLLGLKTLMCDRPECKDRHPGVIMAMNILARATQDYTNTTATPVAVYDKMMNPFAAENALSKWRKAASDLFSMATYKTNADGHEKGDLKIFTSGPKAVPFLNTFSKYDRLFTEMYPSMHDSFIESKE